MLAPERFFMLLNDICVLLVFEMYAVYEVLIDIRYVYLDL